MAPARKQSAVSLSLVKNLGVEQSIVSESSLMSQWKNLALSFWWVLLMQRAFPVRELSHATVLHESEVVWSCDKYALTTWKKKEKNDEERTTAKQLGSLI